MGKRIILSIFTFTLVLVTIKGQTAMIDKTVVKDLDIERYLGTWYEIARFDNSFEKGLVGVTASYSLRKDGKIKVVNAGYKESLDGKRSESVGKAKIPDPKVPSKLKVSFFLFFYGDYYVLELDEDYQWAIVGSSTDKFLWILSRTPQIDKDLYEQLLAKIVKRGYDIDKLIRVKQKSS